MFQRASGRIRFNARNRIGCLWRGLGRLRSCSGFTLTELIVIIVMVGILATTAGVKYGSYSAASSVRVAIDQIAADLRFLQARTMATMAYTGGTYTNTASFPAGGSTYYLGGLVKNLPSGVTLSIGSTMTVTFDSLGEYPTTTDGILTMKSGAAASSLKIYHVSGNIEAY